MKLRTVACWIGYFLLAASGAAQPLVPVTDNSDGASNPYAVISDRNVFHLNPMPPPPEPEQPKVELPVVKLGGFFRVGPQTKAYFCVIPKNSKDKPKNCSLSEGEKKDALEVVKIHFDKGEVDIVNSGVPMTLSVKNDALSAKPEMAANNQAAKPVHAMQPRIPLQPPGGPRGASQGGGNVPFGLPVRQPRQPRAQVPQ